MTFTVSSTADSHDATPGDGLCADTSGHCTLRAALEDASAQASGAVTQILVPAGLYGLTLGALALTHNTVIVSGAGAPRTVISARRRSQVLTVARAANATLVGVTLTGGNAGAHAGGGLANQGATSLIASTVAGNVAAQSGGIDNGTMGRLVLSRSAVLNNTTTTTIIGSGGDGGGIRNSGSLWLSASDD